MLTIAALFLWPAFLSYRAVVYQTVTESPLAILYNDQAPLEHHHLAIMFQILRREGCDIIGHLDKPHRVGCGAILDFLTAPAPRIGGSFFTGNP